MSLAMRTMLTLLALCAASAPALAQKPPKAAGKWEKMDYGPFLTASIQAPKPAKNNAMKGVAVHLGKDNQAAICFDLDLLRYSAGWTGEFLNLKGTPFDGSHGSWPSIKGQQVFGTLTGPGWAKPGTDDFTDPRSEPYGPLPSAWAKYRGLYRHGNQITFSYTVGDCQVLEQPGIETKEDALVFTRTFNLSASKTPLALAVCDVEKAKGEVVDGIASLGVKEAAMLAGLVSAPEGAKLEVANGRILLKLPALMAPVQFRLVLGNVAADKFKTFLGKPNSALDLSPVTKAGPALWNDKIETKGTLGKETGAYAVDTITLPDDNPYHSWMRLGAFDFFADGKRAAVCTWSGDVWIVSGIDDTLEKLVWKRYAAGLFQPLGLKIVDDKVYTLGREGITRLHDLNGDGEADFYEAFNYDVHTTTGFHEFPFDLQTDPQGNFYFAKAGPVRGGGRGFEYIAEHSGCLLKVDKEGKKLEVFASGLRAPNGMGVGPNGEVTTGDNEGTWTPMCRISLVRQGAFLGCVDTNKATRKLEWYEPPICWMPKNVDNSSGGQTWVTSDKWGPLKGHLLHTAYGTSSLYHVLLERDGEHVQGGVVKMPVSFQTGVMRPRFNAVDGQLYVTGLKGWQTNAARDGAFQRVRYTGKPLNMPLALKVVKGGLELTFTDPLDPQTAGNADNYAAKQWNYLWCDDYGSANYKTKDPAYFEKMMTYNQLRLDKGKNKDAIAELAKEFNANKGDDAVAIQSATVSADGKTVTLSIPDVKKVMQFHLKFKLKAADGSPVAQEIYSTINQVPK